VSSDERRQLLLVAPAVGVEHPSDEAGARAAGSETYDVAGQIPVDRSTEGVLEVVPDEPVRGVEQIAQRYIPVQRLGRKRRLEHDLVDCIQSRTQRRNLSGPDGIGGLKPAMQAFDVFTESSQASQVAVVPPQLIVQAPECSAQAIGVIEVASMLNIGDPFCEGHPQAIVLVRAGCDQRTRRNGYPGGRQEPENRNLPLKPGLRIVMQRHSSGHHAGNDRGGSQVHEYVAPGVKDGGLCLR
jgi:hypothetical protein